MDNDGHNFEALVACLSKCLHEKATVTPNDKLVDKHTGRKRQIDISIRITDGPSSFLGIIEARDRSRKVGVPYLEQVKSKRDSVGADKAFIVSNKGFTSAAITKAHAYNIELLSLSKALKHDWSQTFSLFQGFVVSSFGSALTIYFIDENLQIINLHQSVRNMLQSEGMNAKIILNKDGLPRMTANELINPMYREPAIIAKVDSDIHKKHDIRVDFNIPENEEMFCLNENNEIKLVNKFIIIGQIWRELKTYKPQLRQYTNEATGEVIAEVLGTEDPDFDFEMIMEYPTRVDIERKIFLRKKK
jgi:hypothetical protein